MSTSDRTERQALRSLCAGTAVVLCALAAGCGNDPYPQSDSGRAIFYTSFGKDPKTLDPAIAYDFDSLYLTTLFYPSYLQFHYLKRDPYVVEPALGAEEPVRTPVTVSEVIDGRTATHMGERWTFRIKKGLRFQDDPCFPGGRGREIVAADFLASWRRMADPRVACPIYGYFADKVLGIAAYRDRLKADLKAGGAIPEADLNAPIAGLQLDPTDPYRFSIVTTERYPQLRYLMTLPFTSPVAPEAIARYADERAPKGAPDSEKLSRHPVGCGPFVLAEYVRRSRLVLRANPNYRDDRYPSEGAPGDREEGRLADAGRRLPMLTGIEIGIIGETITSFNQFQQGYLDTTGVTQDNFQEALNSPGELSPAMKRRGIRLARRQSGNVSYLAFNMLDTTFGGYSEKNRKLRQAISLALDSPELIDLCYLGLGSPAQWILGPGMFGYEADYRNPYRQPEPELKRARRLLAEAGYPDGIDPATGKRLVLNWENTATTPSGRQLVGIVRRQLSRLGIQVEPHAYLYSALEEKVDRGEFQLCSATWGPDYPDPENYVFLLYSRNSRVRDHGPNRANYANPQYDRLFEQMRSMDDSPQRLAIIRQMRAIVQEDCPLIPYLNDEPYTLLQPWLYNMKPHALAYDVMKYYRVDGAERATLRRDWNRPNYLPAAVLLVAAVLLLAPAGRIVNRHRNRRQRRARDLS